MDVNEPLLSVSTVLLLLAGVRRWAWPLIEPHLKTGLTKRMERWAKENEPVVPEGPVPAVFASIPPAVEAPALRLPPPSPRARPRVVVEDEDETTEVVHGVARVGDVSIVKLQHEVELMRLRAALNEVQDELRELRRDHEVVLQREKELQRRLDAQQAYNRHLVGEQERLRRGDKEPANARELERLGSGTSPARVDRPFARPPPLGRAQGRRPVGEDDGDEGD